MKKLKILPTLLMLVLCVGVLAVGVFAITPTKNTISGTITINSSNPALTINVYKSEINSSGEVAVAETLVDGSPYTVRAGVTLSVGALSFNVATANTTDDVNDIKIRFEVSGATEDLGMYFSKTANAEAASTTEPITLGADSEVKGTFSNYTKLPEGEPASATITFSLEKMPTSAVNVDLSTQNIALNIETFNAEFGPKDDAYYEVLGYGVVGAGKTNITKADYTAVSSPTKVKIADGVEIISADTFKNCTTITDIIFPNTLTTISSNAFNGCTGINSFNIPDRVVNMDVSAFYNCGEINIYTTSLRTWMNIDFGEYTPYSIVADAGSEYGYTETLSNIGWVKWDSQIPQYNLYVNNILLQELTLDEGVSEIGYNAFNGCISITSLNLPTSMKKIDANAFRNCKNLSSISFNSGIETIESCAFAYCTSLESVTLPNTIKNLGNNNFAEIEECAGASECWFIDIFVGCTVLDVDSFNESGTVNIVGGLESITIKGGTVLSTQLPGYFKSYGIRFITLADFEVSPWLMGWYGEGLEEINTQSDLVLSGEINTEPFTH